MLASAPPESERCHDWLPTDRMRTVLKNTEHAVLGLPSGMCHTQDEFTQTGRDEQMFY